MRHARDNRGPYGRRYSAQDLAWEVLSQVESRDYYDIWLTYRPTTGFRGKPGIERFTIDKTGAIRLRSVLERPVRRRTLLAPGIVAGAIVIAGGLVGALFAAGLFPGESEAVLPSTATVSLVPETASQLVSPQGDVTVDLEAGSVAEAVQLSYQPLSPEMTPHLPPGYSSGFQGLRPVGSRDRRRDSCFIRVHEADRYNCPPQHRGPGDSGRGCGQRAYPALPRRRPRLGAASDHRGFQRLYRNSAGRPFEHLRFDHQAAAAGSYFRPYSGRHADLRAGACAFTLSRVDAYADGDGHGHDATSPNHHTRVGTYPNLHTAAYSYPNARTTAYSYPNADPHASSYPYTSADADANAYAHPSTSSYLYTSAHTAAYADASAHPYTNSYPYTSANPFAYAHHADPDAHAHACSGGANRRGRGP